MALAQLEREDMIGLTTMLDRHTPSWRAILQTFSAMVRRAEKDIWRFLAIRKTATIGVESAHHRA
jgi:hypothetical protein